MPSDPRTSHVLSRCRDWAFPHLAALPPSTILNVLDGPFGEADVAEIDHHLSVADHDLAPDLMVEILFASRREAPQ